MKEKIVYQRDAKMTYNGDGFYSDSEVYAKFGWVYGSRYNTQTSPESNEVIFSLDPNGKNKISKKHRKNKIIPVIDKRGKEIREALEGCKNITITIVEIEGEHRILIKGEKSTAEVLSEKETNKNQLKTITFCAGTGVSSEALKESGFSEVAAVEWNPKEGAQDKFSSIYSINHPDSVMFNMPMEKLKGEHLPYADVWIATLDCTDFSKASNGTGKQLYTMHLFIHLMRLFWEREKKERPSTIVIENVPEFEKVAGNSLELCFKEEGYFVSKSQLNSVEYGGRTKRKRFFMVASIHEGFMFPEPTGINKDPIITDGTIRLEDLEWVTPEQSKTLKYFLTRQQKEMSHNHVMTTFDLTKDTFIGTITKSHHKTQPENWIKHPLKKETYAYLKGDHVRALQGIPESLYLGDSNKSKVEAVGQSVCYTTFSKIAKALYTFLVNRKEKRRTTVTTKIRTVRPVSSSKKKSQSYEQIPLFA